MSRLRDLEEVSIDGVEAIRPRLLAVVGSLSAQSINRKLLLGLTACAQPYFEVREARIGDLPLYNRDLDGDLPDGVVRLKAAIEASDAVLFVTPEYNRSIPSALKNAIDWASRPYGQSSWKGKKVALAGASVGALGTAPAQLHLRTILAHLDAQVVAQPELYIKMTPELILPDGSVPDRQLRTLFDSLLCKLATLAQSSGQP